MTLLATAAAIAEPAVPDRAHLSLTDAFQRALETSETLQQRDADIAIAEARYREARAAYLPFVSGIATERYRNSETFGVYGGSGGSDSEGTSGSRPGRKRDEFETILRFQQPLFTGFREYLRADAARSVADATVADRRRARELLYLSVAELFYDIRHFEDDARILGRAIEVLEKRIGELDRFVELGRSRASEVLAAQSELADVRASLEHTIGLGAASRELFAFLINLPSDSFLLLPSPPGTAAPLESYLERARSRADVVAEQKRRTAAEQELSATSREHWGALGLEGNVYPYEDPERNRDWEVLLRLDVPIFDGGAIDARTAARSAELRRQELVVQEREREADRDVRRYFEEYRSAVRENEKLARASDLALKNFEAQQQDYALGVVTNLDVLQALRDAQNARRKLLEASARMAISLVRTEVAAGGIE